MTTIDFWLLGALPVLLLLSAFFSGSETALFGMTGAERSTLRQRKTMSARAIESLLLDPRMLLITVLLGNMAGNVLYFVISSVLMMRSHTNVLVQAGLAIGSLLLIVLLGEVFPKIMANSHRVRIASLIAPPLIAFHRLIGPFRSLLDRVIVTPLARLTSPAISPTELAADELKSLIELSSEEGVIDAKEQRILREVLDVGQLKVREVMTPRVRIDAISAMATRGEVVDLSRRKGWTRLPVYEDDIDHILGILHVKRFLLDEKEGRAAIERAMTPARYVPQMATLEQLFEHFRQTDSKMAIVVDEFGGTAGLVAIEDVVEEFVCEVTDVADRRVLPPQLIGLNRWQVDGDLSARDWAEMFSQEDVMTRATTLGGLITETLGRAAQVGDAIVIGNVRLQAAEVEQLRVTVVEVTLLAPEDLK
jgi:CBS domain containing-hemolysin-like protein